MSGQELTHYESCLDRLREGDVKARDELLGRVCRRLERLARRMLKDFPGVRRWVDTDDVMQNAALRLWRSLADVVPESERHFYNLAALQVRRELIEMSRQLAGVHAAGQPKTKTKTPAALAEATGDTSSEPSKLASWTEFHEQVGKLDADEQEVFHLLWYQELTQAEVAKVMNVSTRTVKRRWQSARLKLHAALQHGLPGM